jgi:hypothetical protein
MMLVQNENSTIKGLPFMDHTYRTVCRDGFVPKLIIQQTDGFISLSRGYCE